jgi:hypothetical protein
MRLSLIAAILPATLCCCSPAFAQLDYMPQADDMSMASISPTSPLGIGSTTSVGGTGIRLGATEIPSPGVSPLTTYSTGTIALPGSGTTCTTLGTSPSGLIGSTDTYDGGGMAMGSATTATGATAGTPTMSGTISTSGQTAGMSAPSATSTDPGLLPISGMSTTYGTGTVGVSGLCGFSSGNMATSPTTPTSTTPTTPGGNPRTGIPLGSWEIANLGVSSSAAIPTPTVLPIVGSLGSSTVVPTTPPVTVPSTTTTTNATNTTTTNCVARNGIPILPTQITFPLFRRGC